MRVRLLVVVLASALALGLGLGFAAGPSGSPAAPSASQPPPGMEAEVLGKVVQAAPVKDAVDVGALPRTGGDATGPGLLLGLVLVALGLVAIDVTGWTRARRARASSRWLIFRGGGG